MKPRHLSVRAPDGRIRPGLRLVLFVLVFFVSGGVLSVVYRLSRDLVPRDPALRSALVGCALALVATGATIVARSRFDHRSLSSLGLDRSHALIDVLAGLALSLLFVAATLALYAQIGWASISRGTITLVEFGLLTVGTALSVAWWEELVFRGYVFQTLQEGVGTVGAILLSCLVYGLVHMANPNATLGSALVIATIGGLRLAGYLLTGQLWISMGMHAGWNLAQGAIFGLAVSGRSSASLLRSELRGPEWAQGGAFGLEASVAGIAYAVLGVLALFGYVRLHPRTLSEIAAAPVGAPRARTRTPNDG